MTCRVLLVRLVGKLGVKPVSSIEAFFSHFVSFLFPSAKIELHPFNQSN